MIRIGIFILFLAFSHQLSAVSHQQSAFSGQQTFSESEKLKTIESESSQANDKRLKAKEKEKKISDSQVLSFSDSQFQYFESQIRLADSLYKNYLPQYNFEEVKAAVEFFDSVQLSAVSRQRWSLFNKKADNEKRLIAESRLLTAAKAHYYHAVGLTERDDIVGACEHYLNALEIMEFETEKLRISKSEKRSQRRKDAKMQSDCHSDSENAYYRTVDRCLLTVDNPKDYEKIRFVALINLRLAELLYENQFCDLSIKKCYDALVYAKLINDNYFEASILKEIGHSYQLLNNSDSALFYYNKSLSTNYDESNYIDIQKCIAKILYEKDDKDKAYTIIRENISKAENDVRNAYYVTLGVMFYNDKIYDSAIINLNKAVANTQSNSIITTSSSILSSIYDSVGNDEMKKYHDNIAIKSLTKINNRSVNKGKIQTLYNEYESHKRQIIEKQSVNKLYLVLIIISGVVILLFLYKHIIHKKNNEDLTAELEDIRQKYNKQETIMSDKDKEIKRIRKELNRKEKNDIKGFRNCDICKKILTDIKDIKSNNNKINNLKPLSEEEIEELTDCANLYLNNHIRELSEKYPQLKKEDLHCVTLSLLNIGEPTIAALMGKSYNSVWKRMKKIKKIVKC